MKRQAKVLAVLLMMFVVFVGQSSAQEMGRHIVTIEGPPGPAEQAVLRAGGAVDHVFDIIPAIAVRIPEQALQGFSRNPFVVNIEPDAMVYAIDTELDNSWGVKRIGAGVVHDSGNKGAGVEVAVLDTGIDWDHPDLDGNIKGGINYVGKGRRVNLGAWDDDNGHGTHVAGIIAAEDNDIGVVGVAPEASLSAVKVLDKNGSGYVSDIIAGLDWCVAENKDVANMSLGADSHVQAFQDACDEASEAGLLLVAAAGNDGSSVDYPAAYDSVIAVSATDISDGIASFSDYGSEVELSAPGVSIYSTYMGGGYATGSGTSMAAPHVAGTAALVIAANIVGVRTQLQNTADDLGDTGWDQYYGYGLVDADEAAGASTGPQSPFANAGPDQTLNDVDGNDSESVTLDGSGSSDADGTIESYEWDTNNDGVTDRLGVIVDVVFAVGTHTVTLTVTDNHGLKDTDEVIITVTEAVSTEAMYVANIHMSLSERKAGRNTFTRALATVTIVDASNNPVAGATVYGFWSDATSDIDSGVTDSSGKVTLRSDAVKNAPSGTTFTFIVDDVVKSGWYWIYVEASNSITVP